MAKPNNNPLGQLGRLVGPQLNIPTPSPVPEVKLAQAAPVLQMTPDIAAKFRKRLINADDDEALKRIVRDAAKYGVDWSHMLTGMEK